jgi:hypothetical protein
VAYANGSLEEEAKAAWVALIKTERLHKPVAVKVVIDEGSKTQTLIATHLIERGEDLTDSRFRLRGSTRPRLRRRSRIG